MKSIKSVLLIEDNPGDARLLREMFNEQGLYETQLTHVGSMSEAEEHLAIHPVEIILLDLGLPDAHGLEAVRRARLAAPRAPLVVLTGMDDETLSAQALQQGAQDYLVKGQIVMQGQLETRGLVRAMRYAIERKVMDDALFAEKERAQVTLDCIADAVVSTDTSGNITFINVVAEKLTGWSWQEAVGRKLGEVLRVMNATSREFTPVPIEIVVGRTSPLLPPSNSILVRRDGVEIPIENSVAPIHNREGQTTGAVVVFRDVSAGRAMALQITHQAQHDFLTGLPNRVLLNDRIGQAIALARRNTRRVAVLFLDLDGFKHINDSLGHPIGDKLLKSIAERLVGCVRASDTVSRQGGDEFVVLLSDLEKSDGADVTARRLLEAVAEVHSIDNQDIHVTTSIGVSVYPDDGPDAEALIKSADTAMYQAKEDGRQSYQFFKPVMNIRAVERQFIEEGLRCALQRGELLLLYQPKVNLATGAITGAEALIRWMHPSRGLISPAQFIPVAEESGLIVPIGAWVLRTACEQARAWVDAGLPLKAMAVNVSAREFRDEKFLERLCAILRDSGMDPGSLELELTESVLMKHAEFTASILQTLRKRGVQIAVDDFGTGYSSLSYLLKFPIDVLKIDQSFVRQIGNGGADKAIVTAVIAMAKSLSLRVVAEGVETKEELDFLGAQQCDEAQGFYFSRPVLPKQFEKLLQSGRLDTNCARRYDMPEEAEAPHTPTEQLSRSRAVSG